MKALLVLGYVSRNASEEGVPLSDADLYALDMMSDEAGVDADVVLACQARETWARKPSMKQVRAERDRLLAEIEASDATAVVAFGPVAVQALWNRAGLKVEDLKHKVHHLPGIRLPVVVTNSLEEVAMKPGLAKWVAMDLILATKGETPCKMGRYVVQQDRHQDLRIDGVCAVDLETFPGTDPWDDRARIRMLSISGTPGFAQVVHCGAHSELPKWVVDILRDPSIEKVGSNIRFDYIWLRRFGYDMVNYFCTGNQQHLIDENMGIKDLKTLALIYTDLGDYSAAHNRLCKERGGWEHVTDEEQFEYAGADADASITIHLKQMEKIREQGLEQTRALMKYYYQGISELQYNGACIDLDATRDLDTRYKEEIAQLTARIREHFKRPINPRSPAQLVPALRELVPNVDLRLFFRNKDEDDEEYTTIKTVLQREAQKHPVIGDILAFRRRVALHNFVKSIPGHVTTHHGRTFVHSSLRSDIAVTYRHSSSHPNMQNLPRAAEEEDTGGLNVKRQYVSRFEGGMLMEADQSQLELRETAMVSGDEALVDAFMSGQDVHSQLAAMMHGVPLEEVTKQMRQDSKTTNFHVLYGGRAWGLSQRLGCTYAHAKTLIEAFDATFLGFVRWRAEQHAKARRSLRVVSRAGFPRRFIRPPTWDTPAGKRILRQAVNAPIQNVASVLTNIGICQVVERLKRERLRSVAFLTVHDSLVVDIYPGELEQVARIVKEEMENPAPKWGIECRIPLTVDIKIGDNWGSMREYEAN